MDSYSQSGSVAQALFGLFLIAALVYGFVWVILHLTSKPDSRKQPTLTSEKLGQVAVGLIIALLIPTAINLMAYAFDPLNQSYGVFGLTIIISILAFIGGLSAKRNKVVSVSVVAGATLALLYAILARYSGFTSLAKALIELIALLGITLGAHWVSEDAPTRPSWGKTVLTGFNGIVLAIITFAFAWAFSNHAAGAVDPTFFESTYGVNRAIGAGEIAFIAVFVWELIVGLLIRRVQPVAVGFILAGAIGIIFSALPTVIDAGTKAAALAAAIAAVVLIVVAYKRFTPKEGDTTSEDTTCPKCATKNKPGSKFCRSCGSQLT